MGERELLFSGYFGKESPNAIRSDSNLGPGKWSRFRKYRNENNLASGMAFPCPLAG